MATRAEIIADVYSLTKRPDLVAETDVAVRAATLKAHHSDFFPKDLFETGIQWNPTDYIQELDYRNLIPRWRAFKYLRKAEVTGEGGKFFDLILPEQVLDSYNITRDDVCYLAGEVLKIRSSSLDSYMLLGCYLNPVITETGYSSWIALDCPYAIVYDAAATIFKTIGFDEQERTYRNLVAEQYAYLKQNVVANGY